MIIGNDGHWKVALKEWELRSSFKSWRRNVLDMLVEKSTYLIYL